MSVDRELLGERRMAASRALHEFLGSILNAMSWTGISVVMVVSVWNFPNANTLVAALVTAVATLSSGAVWIALGWSFFGYLNDLRSVRNRFLGFLVTNYSHWIVLGTLAFALFGTAIVLRPILQTFGYIN